MAQIEPYILSESKVKSHFLLFVEHISFFFIFIKLGQSTQSPINSKKRDSNDLVSIDVIEYFQSVTVLSINSGADFTAAVVKRLHSSSGTSK